MCSVPPFEDSAGVECHPFRWLTGPNIDVEPHVATEAMALQPRSVVLAFAADALDRVGHAQVGGRRVGVRRAPEAVGRREDTVEPPPRVEEHEDTIIDGLAAASPTDEAPREEVVLPPPPGRLDPRSVAGAQLIAGQAEEGVGRGVGGGDPRADDPFAVPATVILLVFEEPVDEPIDVRIEPESVRQGP